MEGDSGITQSGVILGTPSYMAPEQASGQKRLTTAADIYSLGAVLYELLTGKPPFRADTPLDTLLQVLEKEPPRPRSLNPRIHRDLETICLKCLEKDPRKRYGSAEALAEDLERFLEDRPILARQVGGFERFGRWCRRKPAVAGLIAALATVFLAGFVGIAWNWQQAEQARHQTGEERDRAIRAEQDVAAERDNARREQLRAETARYAMQLNLVERELDANQLRRALNILNDCDPKLRHWEYRYLKRLCQDRMRLLKEIPGGLHALALSPDGKRLATAGWDGVIHILDMASGAELLGLRGPPGRFTSVQFSADGLRLAASSSDDQFQATRRPAEVWVWEVPPDRRGEVTVPLFSVSRSSTTISKVAFSPDGQHLATAGGLQNKPGEVLLWRLQALKPGEPAAPLLTFQGHEGAATDVAFSPDGQQLASAGADKTIRLWDCKKGRILRIFKRVADGIHLHVAISPDGKTLVSSANDDALFAWNLATGKEIFNTIFSPGFIMAENLGDLAFSSNGKYLAWVGAMKLRVWEVGTSRIFTYNGYGFPIGVAFHPDNQHFVSASMNGQVALWQVLPSPGARTLKEQAGAIHGLTFSPTDQRLATASQDGTVVVWDPGTGKPVLTVPPSKANLPGLPDHVAKQLPPKVLAMMKRGGPSFDCVAFSSDGRRLAAGSGTCDQATGHWRTGEVHLWDAATGQVVTTLKDHAGAVTRIAFSPDGQWLASAASDLKDRDQPGEVRVWNAANGKLVHILKGLPCSVTGVAFSSDSQWLAAGSGWLERPSKVIIWDVVSGTEKCTLEPPRPMATQSSRKVDVVSGTEKWALKDLNTMVNSVAFSPIQPLLAIGVNKELQIWDPTGGREMERLKGHSGSIHSLAFTPDGKRLASATGDMGKTGEVLIWDTTTWQQVLSLKEESPNEPAVHFNVEGQRLGFSAEGNWLATSGNDGEVKIWNAALH